MISVKSVGVVMIRGLLLTTVLCVSTNRAYADELQWTELSAPTVTDLQLSTATRQVGIGTTSRPLSQHHCCNKKGAIIGAAAGAVGGVLLLRSVCDGDCALGYVKYMAILGGIGATLGAFADAHHGPAPFPDRRVRVVGIATPKVRAVLATVRLGHL